MDNPFADPSVQSTGSYQPASGEEDLGSEFHTAEAEDAPWLQSSAETFEQDAPFPEGPIDAGGAAEGVDVPLFQNDEEMQTTPAPTGGGSEPAPVAKIKAAISDITTAPLPKLIKYMRMANVGVATLMVTSALFTLLTTWSMSTLIISIYVAMFGCMLCCFETHARTVSAVLMENFGFMYDAKGRFVFLVLLSTLCFGLDLIGKITAVMLCLVALLNLYVIIKFPEYAKGAPGEGDEEAPESLTSLASSVASNVAKSNPDAVKTAMSTTASWAAANPGTAKQFAGAFSGKTDGGF